MNHSEPPGADTRPLASADLWVICLCADWCHICRQMQSALADDRRLSSVVRWLWVDIEEHADLLGDLEVETFPTYLIGRHDDVLLYAPGPTQSEAIMSYVMPYATGRMTAAPVSRLVRQAFAAITFRFKTR